MPHAQRGFTLVELAIALVIIGLVLGMTFKGRELIDGAKVKSVQAQYGKISAAMNIFFEKYGWRSQTPSATESMFNRMP